MAVCIHLILNSFIALFKTSGYLASILNFTSSKNWLPLQWTDEVDNAFSALYTFFKPELEHRSIGTLAILQQILLAQTKKQTLFVFGIPDR